MRNIFEKWITKNKILLITFGVTSIVTILITYLEFRLIISNFNDLDQYARTGVITDGLESVGLLGLFNLVLIGFWSLLLLMVMWKVIFPSSSSVKNAFYGNELSFLLEMPSRVKRGLDK